MNWVQINIQVNEDQLAGIAKVMGSNPVRA